MVNTKKIKCGIQVVGMLLVNPSVSREFDPAQIHANFDRSHKYGEKMFKKQIGKKMREAAILNFSRDVPMRGLFDVLQPCIRR